MHYSGVIGFLFGVIPYLVSRSMKQEVINAQSEFVSSCVKEWNEQAEEVEEKLKGYEAISIPFRNALVANIDYYSDVVMKNLEKSPVKEEVYGKIPRVWEIKENILYLEEKFPKNESYLTEEIFVQMITQQTGIKPLEKGMGFGK